MRIPTRTLTLFLITAVAVSCASVREPYTTKRDKTKKGAAIGAATGAVVAVLDGEKKAEEILAGAAIGGALGAGVGAYMDHQEEKFARIPGTHVERLEENLLLVRFEDSILFDVDSAIVKSGSRGTLNEVASVMIEYPKTAVIVQGHTDSTGSEEHNQDLSERRAKSVYNHLIGAGIAADRMTSVGYGEGSPVASNDTAAGRQQNRRVDLLLKAKAK